jgi:hypothetical protein
MTANCKGAAKRQEILSRVTDHTIHLIELAQ